VSPFLGFITTKKEMTASCHGHFLFDFIVVKKVMIVVAITFFFGFVATKKVMATSYHRILIFSFVTTKKVTTTIVVGFFFVLVKNKKMAHCVVIFFFGFIATKKATTITIVAFFFVFEKKKTTKMSHCFLLWFCCSEDGDDTKLPLPSFVLQRRRQRQQLLSPFFMALLQEMATIITFAFFGGFVMKKVKTPMSSPSFMVAVL